MIEVIEALWASHFIKFCVVLVVSMIVVAGLHTRRSN